MIRLQTSYAGSEWLKASLDAMHARAALRPRGRCNMSKILSPLGVTVADVLGHAWRGIYHLTPGSLNKPQWHDPRHIVVNVPASHLSTYDGDVLTVLVVTCFDAMLRLEIVSSGPRLVGLGFSRRTKRSGSIYERLPHLDDMVAGIRRGYDVVEDAEPEEQSA